MRQVISCSISSSLSFESLYKLDLNSTIRSTMPPRTSSLTGKQQTKLSFVSSKSSAAASKSAKAAVLGKPTKASVKKEELAKEEIDSLESSEEDKRDLDDIDPPSSEDEKDEVVKTAKNLERPTVEKRDLSKTSSLVKATRTSSGTRKVSGTTAAAEAVAEKVAKIKQEPEVDVSSRPHLEVKDTAYSDHSNKASEQLGFLAPSKLFSIQHRRK